MLLYDIIGLIVIAIYVIGLIIIISDYTPLPEEGIFSSRKITKRLLFWPYYLFSKFISGFIRLIIDLIILIAIGIWVFILIIFHLVAGVIITIFYKKSYSETKLHDKIKNHLEKLYYKY